jgi:hypothetical protein
MKIELSVYRLQASILKLLGPLGLLLTLATCSSSRSDTELAQDACLPHSYGAGASGAHDEREYARMMESNDVPQSDRLRYESCVEQATQGN